MSCISRISKLNSCGVFRHFEWPDDLPEFGRYNLIYGWNGTGKTTLSRILRCLEKRKKPEGEVTIALDGATLKGDKFPTATIPVRVFNREFIAENVFRSDGGDLPPIFILGEESVEKQKEVERLKANSKAAELTLNSARTAKQKAERELDQFCIERAKVIKDTLRSSGQNPYNNYNKADFRTDVEEMTNGGGAVDHSLTDEKRDSLLVQHRAMPKPKVQELTFNLPNFELIVARVSELLSTSVVSQTIAALKADSTVASWTRQGLVLHRDRNAEHCLFCEQPLPKDRLKALEAHFSTQYEQFMQSLDNFIRELEQSSKAVKELRLPNKAELYDDLAPEFEAAKTELSQALEATRAFLDVAVQELGNKKNRAFESVEVTLQPPQIDTRVIEKQNAVIRKHNQACDEFQIRVDEARKRLAKNMTAEALNDFIRLWNGLQQASADVQKAEQEVHRLNAEISRLEQEIVEHRRPAEELNEDLRKYLGHNELELEIKDTGYAITRGGVPAQALSEGEMTAIALLYFLKSLQDKGFDPANGVVVLDDPVSSLDANALYLAFGFMRDRTKDAGQLIIFTHNFTFFRQVRNWFHHLPNQNKRDINQRPARFYMLDCEHDQNGRCASIRRLDPLLEQYETEYHYLFSRMYRAANETTPTSLEENYILPNMARRLLEAFLAFRQPQLSGELWKQMQEVKFDEAKKMRILRFLNTYSHSNAIGEPEHDPFVLAEGREVLKDLLDLIKAQDNAHYEAMLQLIAPTAESEQNTGEGTTA